MSQILFIGVDGGATKTLVRVEDEAGNLLGMERSGPANIRVSVEQAWYSINSALKKILYKNAIALTPNNNFHIGVGIAGYEIKEAYEAFLGYPHPFRTMRVESDAHTACLGAHQGEDGAIIIAGTGSVGYQMEKNHITKMGGWGFPHDDEGSGAWLGMQAIKTTLQSLDGRLPSSSFSQAVYSHFDEDLDHLVRWANQANTSMFAELAPLVIHLAQKNDEGAIALLKQAAVAIDCMAAGLIAAQTGAKNLPFALAGGIAPFLIPFLGSELRSRLRPCQFTADKGAIFLVRHHLKETYA